MKVKITLTVDREPIELAPSGDLADAEKLCLDDREFLMWILEKKFQIYIEATDK